jgi:hypothetical protein
VIGQHQHTVREAESREAETYFIQSDIVIHLKYQFVCISFTWFLQVKFSAIILCGIYVSFCRILVYPPQFNQITNSNSVQFSPYGITSRLKAICSHHPIVEHPLSQNEGQSFIPIKTTGKAIILYILI